MLLQITKGISSLKLLAIATFVLLILHAYIAKELGYTFFSGERKTTVDYILLSTSVSHSIAECYTHDHHDLNFSDHLPILVLLKIENLTESQATEIPKVNWRKPLQDGLIPLYAPDVFDAIYPLLSCGFQSVSELNEEIISVCHTLTQAVFKHLPSIHHRKIKPCIKDSELNFLRKQSRKAWECWKSACRSSSCRSSICRKTGFKEESASVCCHVSC